MNIWKANTASSMLRIFAVALTMLCVSISPAKPVDPVYQPEMSRLLSIMGSLYFLDPLCSDEERFWRFQAEELIILDQPDPDRMARLIGSFNQGYLDYSRLHRSCTPSARLALDRLLAEADEIAQDIYSRFSE